MQTTLQRAIALQEDGKSSQALPLFEAAIREDPMNPDVWYHAGVTAAQLRHFRLGVGFLQMFVRLRPRSARGWAHLGFAHFGLGEYEAAAADYERVLALEPDHVNALAALGHLSRMLGRVEASTRYYERLLADPSTGTTTLVDKALVLLGRGEYAAGWSLFEQRSRSDSYLEKRTWRPPAAREWRGEHVPDKTVCAYLADGYGDTFALARYLPFVAERARAVLTATRADVDSFVATVPGVTRAVRPTDYDDPDVLFVDYWSLPALLLDRVDAVPEAVPYFSAPASGPRLERRDGRMLVALVWAGSPLTIHDHDRSVPSVELLRPLFDVPHVDWVSLQVGPRAAEGDALPIAPCPALDSFADTAFALAQLDLVVTVDTSVANLAGALGLPVWVMVPTWPEWRWPGATERTPWFPTARLFRRATTSEWPAMIARMTSALGERVAQWRAGGARAARPER